MTETLKFATTKTPGQQVFIILQNLPDGSVIGNRRPELVERLDARLAIKIPIGVSADYAGSILRSIADLLDQNPDWLKT